MFKNFIFKIVGHIHYIFLIPVNFQYIHHILPKVHIKYRSKLHMLRLKKELPLSS